VAVIKMGCYFRGKANVETLKLTRVSTTETLHKTSGNLGEVLMDKTVSSASGLN